MTSTPISPLLPRTCNSVPSIFNSVFSLSPFLATLTKSAALPSQKHASASPLFATLTAPSILRIPQLLCLPLLRKLPGCPNSLPNLERCIEGPSLRISNFDSRSSILSILFVFTFLQTLWQHRNPQLFSFQAFPNSFTKTPGVGYPPRNVTLAAPKARPSPSSTSLTSSTSSTSRLSRAMDLYRQEGEYLPSEARHAIGAEQSW